MSEMEDYEDGTTAQDVERGLIDMLYGDDDEFRETVMVDETRTFEESGVLTRDNGIVLRMVDGREFQVTIVRSN